MALILRNGGSQSPDRWLRDPRNNQHINISYDGANKSVQIRIVSTEEGMQEDYIEEEQ